MPAPDLRALMRNFATGVCVATTYADRTGGRHHDAVTINSLGSVSLDPPLVSICLRLTSLFLTDLLATKKWAVSILPQEQRAVAAALAKDRATRAAAVGGLAARPGPQTGALVLDGASWLECVLRDSLDLADHTLVVGEVVTTDDRRQGQPLVFVHGGYHMLADPGPAVVAETVHLDEWW